MIAISYSESTNKYIEAQLIDLNNFNWDSDDNSSLRKEIRDYYRKQQKELVVIVNKWSQLFMLLIVILNI